MEANARARVIIHGRVQGVFFRLETRKAARRFGATGWVRNLPDGTVEAVMEGSHEAVTGLLGWCEQGPRMACVDKLELHNEPYTGKYDSFKVVYS